MCGTAAVPGLFCDRVQGPTFTPHYSAERVGIINLEKKC